jgi:hypothetical protein
MEDLVEIGSSRTSRHEDCKLCRRREGLLLRYNTVVFDTNKKYKLTVSLPSFCCISHACAKVLEDLDHWMVDEKDLLEAEFGSLDG